MNIYVFFFYKTMCNIDAPAFHANSGLVHSELDFIIHQLPCLIESLSCTCICIKNCTTVGSAVHIMR